MKTITLLKELERYPLVDTKTVRSLVGKSSAYTALLLHRLQRQKLLTKLGRDCYTVQDDPLVIASHLVWPAYLSLWTALRYHNLTEQLPNTIFVLTTRQKRKKLKVGNMEIRFLTIRPSLLFGYRKESITGFEVFIAEPEKAILDALLLRKISVSELRAIMQEHHSLLDQKKMVAYALQLKNKALARRLGWLLEKSKKIDYSQKLRPLLTGNYFLPLDYTIPAKGKKNIKWRLIENVIEDRVRKNSPI